MDLYSSVPSPSLNFLGTPIKSITSSFLSSSLTRRHTPEVLPSVQKPLLASKEPEQKRRSSQALLPPLPAKSSFIRKGTPDRKLSAVSHEVPISHQSSFGQAVLNGIVSTTSLVNVSQNNFTINLNLSASNKKYNKILVLC